MDVTSVVVIVNVAVSAPAPIATFCGSAATALSLVSVTEMPPGGAGPINEMVPFEELLPATLFGFRVTAERTG